MEVRRTVTGFAALAAATLFAQILGFFILAVITRRIPAADVGAFNFALALTAYFGIPANLGITTLAIRDLARRPQDARAIFGEVAVLQAVLAAVPYAALVLLAPVLAPDAVTQTVIPIVGLAFLVDVASAQWVLYGRQRFAWLAIGRVLGALAFAALVLVAVEEPDGALRLAWVHVAGGLATAVLTLAIALRAGGMPRVPGGTRALDPPVRPQRAARGGGGDDDDLRDDRPRDARLDEEHRGRRAVRDRLQDPARRAGGRLPVGGRAAART